MHKLIDSYQQKYDSEEMIIQEKERHKEQLITQRILALREERKRILSLPAEKALNEILESPQPAALVHSFPEQDFYFLIHDIGAEDSLELLSLASDKQVEYILDIETWHKDRISVHALTKWFYLIQKADPNRLIHWLSDEEKTEFIEFYMFQNMQVFIREHDQDPSDLGGDLFSIDDIFYIRFLDTPFEQGFGDKEERDTFLTEFLHRLAANDHIFYQNLLLEYSGIINAESEENIYRMRNIRLAEKGFMPSDEAIGIYQPLKPKNFKNSLTLKKLASDKDISESLLPIPVYSANMLKPDNYFSLSLQAIEIDDIIQQLQAEFAGLCNQVISADQKIIREKEELKNIVKKVCGYLSIGLERLSKKPLETSRMAALVQKVPISQIFRVGYGLAVELKWKAEKWRKGSWFEKEGLGLTFWGEEWLGVLGGLLLKRPLFYDNYKTGVLYREFASIEEIRQTEKILNNIIAFDNLLLMTDLPVKPTRWLTYKSFLLTSWARDYIGLPEELHLIKMDRFRQFFKELWENTEKPRKIRLEIKESFLTWLSRKTSMDAYEITQIAGEPLENLFQEIESEYGEVSASELNPKHIYLFRVI